VHTCRSVFCIRILHDGLAIGPEHLVRLTLKEVPTSGSGRLFLAEE
jgi:hypothetical protein